MVGFKDDAVRLSVPLIYSFPIIFSRSAGHLSLHFLLSSQLLLLLLLLLDDEDDTHPSTLSLHKRVSSFCAHAERRLSTCTGSWWTLL